MDATTAPPLTPEEESDLRQWAEAFALAGHIQARRVLSLLAELDALRKQVSGHVERIAAQSELLSRRAERVIVMPSSRVVPPAFDGAYPVTPDSAGKSSERVPNSQQ